MMKYLVGECYMKNIKVLGAGFTGIDLIKGMTQSSISLGGTAANVLTILSQLGFETTLLTAEYAGELGDWYKNALQVRQITPIYFQKSKKCLSVIIEDINHDNNVHFFRTSCSKCKSSFINVILPSDEKIKKLPSEINECNLLFYDRFSSGINYVANINQKGWNMYEPNAFRLYTNLLNGCRSSDIVKFSTERIPDKICNQLLNDLVDTRVKITIVTMGQKGLKFTIKKNGGWGEWNYFSSIKNKNIVDTAGAGDWLTAGFLYELLSEYPKAQNVGQEKIAEKIKRAQLLATAACDFVGAQGMLKEPKGVEQLRLITGKDICLIKDKPIKNRISCPICGLVQYSDDI